MIVPALINLVYYRVDGDPAQPARVCPPDAYAFAYIIGHSGARVVCAHEDYLETIDRVRPALKDVTHFVALEGTRDAWARYEELVAAAPPEFAPPAIEETGLLTINYTSGTTSRPKGVMITHRNAYMNAVGTLLHLPMQMTDRYLWTLPMFHANGWTYTWMVTAVGATHVCLRKVDPTRLFEAIESERITSLCAAPTVLIGLANAADELRRSAPRGIRVTTAGAPPAAATIERLEDELGWTVTQVYGLTETAPLISGGENISSIEVEGVLLRHPAVHEAAVVGLPDQRWGEAPHAFVVLKAHASATAEELREFARERLAHFKAPHSVTFVAELPKTATGKIQKFVLRGGRTAISAQ